MKFQSEVSEALRSPIKSCGIFTKSFKVSEVSLDSYGVWLSPVSFPKSWSILKSNRILTESFRSVWSNGIPYPSSLIESREFSKVLKYSEVSDEAFEVLSNHVECSEVLRSFLKCLKNYWIPMESHEVPRVLRNAIFSEWLTPRKIPSLEIACNTS